MEASTPSKKLGRFLPSRGNASARSRRRRLGNCGIHHVQGDFRFLCRARIEKSPDCETREGRKQGFRWHDELRRRGMKSLFVGNMSFQMTESELSELFKPFGQVTRVNLVKDRETGRARGFAFVE